MSAIVLFLLLLVSGQAVDGAQTAERGQAGGPADAALARGVAAYEAGDWSAAAAHLSAARDGGHAARAALWFAIGHCAYRQGDTGRALHAYRQGEAAGADASAVAAAVAVAEARAGLAPGGSAPPPAALESRVALLAALFLVQCCGLVWFLRRRARARVAGLVLAVAALGAAVATGTRLTAPTAAAVVVAPGQVLRAEPHPASPAGAVLAAGEGVAVLQASDRWARVRARDGEGWVPTQALGRVQPGGGG